MDQRRVREVYINHNGEWVRLWPSELNCRVANTDRRSEMVNKTRYNKDALRAQGYMARMDNGSNSYGMCPYHKLNDMAMADCWLEGYWEADRLVQRRFRQLNMVMAAVALAAVVIPVALWFFK